MRLATAAFLHRANRQTRGLLILTSDMALTGVATPDSYFTFANASGLWLQKKNRSHFKRERYFLELEKHRETTKVL